MKTLEFEKNIREVEEKIEGLRHLVPSDGMNIVDEIKRLESKLKKQMEAVYKKLTPWQKTQVARHEDRPHALDYIKTLVTDWTPLRGDRCFGDDEAIVGGIGRFNGRTVMVIGQEKGHDTQSRLKHNFGMAKPEGYRKAIRLMQLAEHFGLPVLTFVDTAGAFPGLEGEERGQAEAIAKAMDVSLGLTVPVVATVIGEGGSGGAIAIATANAVLMLENAIYSVISPEGCASILWKDAAKAAVAAETLHLTAQDLLKLKIVDEVIEEPLGGAHRGPKEAIEAVGRTIDRYLSTFDNMPPEIIKKQRQDKFMTMTRLDG